MTFSPLLSIPTVGKYPPGGTTASFLPMIFPLRVKNTWGGGGTSRWGGDIGGCQGTPPPPPKSMEGKGLMPPAWR